ncbi:MAG: glycine cleavage system protein H [Planctomycetaceae bacterium]|nr:glycine cleavage system protein H [Planctomycetaceae bacterium]
MKPEELKYAKTHEWVHVDGSKEHSDEADATATVGISAFAVEALTDLVFLELPRVGQQVQPGESLGEVESVKAVSDIYSPVAGEVLEVNQELPESLEWLGEDPYGRGWIARVRLAKDASLEHLMDHAAYSKMCAEEEH